MSIFMSIDGISGDVSAKGYENWIEVYSLYFESKRILTTQPGRTMDREGTQPTISEFIISKRMDKSSPILFHESVVGKAHSTIKISLNTTSGQLNQYMEYNLSNVIISSYTLDTLNTKEQYPLESITLNFDKIEMKFTPYDEDHKPQSPISTGYDLNKAVAL